MINDRRIIISDTNAEGRYQSREQGRLSGQCEA